MMGVGLLRRNGCGFFLRDMKLRQKVDAHVEMQVKFGCQTKAEHVTVFAK